MIKSVEVFFKFIVKKLFVISVMHNFRLQFLKNTSCGCDNYLMKISEASFYSTRVLILVSIKPIQKGFSGFFEPFGFLFL